MVTKKKLVPKRKPAVKKPVVKKPVVKNTKLDGRKNNTFGREKGCTKTGGREKGTPNKTTALLKDAILMAAKATGDDYKAMGRSSEEGLVGYLELQSKLNPGPFLSLLSKVLPMQLTGIDDGPIETKWTVEFINATSKNK